MSISQVKDLSRLSSNMAVSERDVTKKSRAAIGQATGTAESVLISISEAAKILLARDSHTVSSDIQKQLEAIKAKPAVERTAEDAEFIKKNDSKWTEIASKAENTRTADELDYMQRAGGFVNTMAYLTPKERQLYDEIVSSGHSEALRGMNLIAMSRVGNDNTQITLPNGTSFNPVRTEITADNVLALFQHMFVDETGDAQRSFEALSTFLQKRAQA